MIFHLNEKQPFSLRLRLVLLAALILLISLSLVYAALDAAFQSSSEAGLKTRMETLVYLVLAATEVGGNSSLTVAEATGDPRLDSPGSGFYAHLHGENDEWSSASSLGIGLPELPPFNAGESGFVTPTTSIDYYTFRYGISWELPDGNLLPLMVTILVEPSEFRGERKAFRAGLLRSLGAAGAILILAQLILLTLGLRPLRRMSRDIAGIESGQLERLEGRYPRELERLTANINQLLDTEKANQTRYRNALDSLAHSLKTPLSVIRSSLPADTAAKSSAINSAVGDMRRLVATRLQRAAASTRRSMAPAVDVKVQVDRLTRSLQRVYSQDLIRIDVSIEDGLMFYGEARDLLELMGNLLDNGCKYGDGQIRLAARSHDLAKPQSGIDLKVEDNGPGIAKAERQQLLQRGVRGDERAEGHGLGLAIVLEIVTAYNGEIVINDSDLGGAGISVTLRTRLGTG